MFCFQCEQTGKGNCHTTVGICGKDNDTAVMQDVLVYCAKSLSVYANELRNKGLKNKEYDHFVIEALFTTVTNVNFDIDKVKEFVKKGYELKEEAKKKFHDLSYENGMAEVHYKADIDFLYTDDTAKLLEFGESISLFKRREEQGADIVGMQELILYGLKGTAAYVDHAIALNYEIEEVYSFFHEALALLATQKHPLNDLLNMALKVGEINLKVMELLDKAHNETFGAPVPTPVRITPVKGKAILVSGHDLKDLEELLKQTDGKGINIYTHGEMLPAHGYPKLKQYKHLVGNYGGAWQDQEKEFDQFPGAILMTTNCIQKPKGTYIDRIYTCGLVQWPNVEHIGDRNFAPVIAKALEQPGFTEDGEEKTILTGFGHNAVLGVADKVIEAVKEGKIKHFFLIGGCDGAKSGRNYYTEFATKAPEDTIILTLACGKYRFNKLEFGNIGGIPRLLDVGQCNDAYSAIKIAVALSEAFNTDVNSLPLSLILSWYEQKAVAILLTLLHLGIKNIRIGPSLPSFIEPNVLRILIDNFNLMPIKTAEEDLKAILNKK